jgi:hypothetical protein
MPTPIPQLTSIGDTLTDLHYMSFADAQKLLFTGEHQLSLVGTIFAPCRQ